MKSSKLGLIVPTHHHVDAWRQTGQPLSMVATVAAQAPQNRECPHGTNATPSRGAIKHTTQVSSTDCAEVTVVLSDVTAVVAWSGCCCCCSSSYSFLNQWSPLLCQRRPYEPLGCGLWPSEIPYRRCVWSSVVPCHQCFIQAHFGGFPPKFRIPPQELEARSVTMWM